MAADPLASIGKGIVQVNLRPNRVLELLEQGASTTAGAPATGETRDILFELLDAVESALAPLPRPGGGLGCSVDRRRRTLSAAASRWAAAGPSPG